MIATASGEQPASAWASARSFTSSTWRRLEREGEPDERRLPSFAVEEAGEDFSPNTQIAAGIHELAHALVAVDRQEDDPKLTRGQEEVVVECVAYTVCASLGLDTSDSSIPYMTGWSKGDEVEHYAGLIVRLARRIEDTLLEAEDPQAEASPRQAMPEVALAA